MTTPISPATPVKPSTTALITTMLADLTGWIGCAWTIAFRHSHDTLEPVHVCGVQPSLSACRDCVLSAVEKAGTLSNGTVIRLAHGALHPWMPDFITTVAIEDHSLIFAFGPKRGAADYDESDFELILDATAQLTSLLRRDRLAAAIAADMALIQEIRSDLARARDVQSRMFPNHLPRIAGLDYYGECRQVSQVGGDFFDFVPLEGDRLAVSVGDVSGHGVSAAILMSGLQAYLRSFTLDYPGDPAEVMHRLNRTVYDICPDNYFATLFYAQFNPARGLLEYVSAGHEPALLVRCNGRIERLEATGTVLGLCPESHYARRRVNVEPGDVLIAFTDGITEAPDATGRAFCDRGVIDVVREHFGDRATDLVWQIAEAATRHSNEPNDDRTVIAVRLTERALAQPWVERLVGTWSHRPVAAYR